MTAPAPRPVAEQLARVVPASRPFAELMLAAPADRYPCYCLPGPARCDDPHHWCDRGIR